MSRISLRTAISAACVLVLAQRLPAQYQGGLGLGVGFTKSEKPVISASYIHCIMPQRIYGVGGFAFFHPGSQLMASEDPNTYFASVTQVFGGVQIGEVLFVTPRLSYNWYGPYRSFGWGISGGFSIPVTRKFSLGLAASHDQVRFDDAVDAYGPTPFTSVSVVAKIWIFRQKP